MHYDKICRAVFLDRPNRFIAHIELDGRREVCHVKNTGRCRELLVPGAQILVQDCLSPGRRTRYDLISVWKGDRLINMDAAAPNRVFREWLEQGGLGAPEYIRPECRHGDSRFDFYIERHGAGMFCEVKGVTLERDGVVRFPDAPTLRGVKHLRGLAACVAEGYQAAAVFIVQMENVRYFTPAAELHPEFAQALREARAAGVEILALDCRVTETEIAPGGAVEVRL